MSNLPQTDPFIKIKRFLRDATKALQKLNRSKFADLRTQLYRARADLEGGQHQFSQNPGDIALRQKEDMARAHYIHIMSSVIDIIR